MELALIVAYRLPVPVVMTGPCLGLRVEATFGGADVEIRIPHDQSPDETLDEDDFSLMRRTRTDAAGGTIAGSESITDAWRRFNEPGADSDAPDRSVDVHRVLIGVSTSTARLAAPRTGVGHSTEARLQDELYAQADAWHDVFRSWIEVTTAQDLDHVQRRWSAHIEGSTMATFTPAGARNLSGVEYDSTTTTRPQHPADSFDTRCFARVNSTTPPWPTCCSAMGAPPIGGGRCGAPSSTRRHRPSFHYTRSSSCTA